MRVAHGTKEVFGRVLFMDGHAKLKQNEQATAQIRLDEPLCVLRGDRFVIRAATPVRVIGGGRVLAGHPRRRSILSESDKAVLSSLACDDVTAAAKAYIEEPKAIRTVADIAGALDVSEAEAARIAKTIGRQKYRRRGKRRRPPVRYKTNSAARRLENREHAAEIPRDIAQ